MTQRRKPGRKGPILAGLTLVLASCAGITVSSEWQSPRELGAFESYAWAADSLALRAPAADPADDPLIGRARRAVDGELAGRGLQGTAREQADLLVQAELGVERKVQTNDPYFAYYATEMVEIGTLAITLHERSSGSAVWRGTGRRRLRNVSYRTGILGSKTVSSSQEREWRIEEMVEEILAELP